MAHSFKLIVFNIEKPQNIGILMRTAYAFGCDELLVVGRRKLKVTGASHTHRVLKWRHFFSMKDAAAHCRHEGCRIVGVEIGGDLITDTRFDDDVAFILGNEGRGLADALPFCESLVTVPQWRGVPSLNVAVAGALVMFEFQRQQGLPVASSHDQKYYDHNYRLE